MCIKRNNNKLYDNKNKILILPAAIFSLIFSKNLAAISFAELNASLNFKASVKNKIAY